MKINDGDDELIGMVINEPGMKLIEQFIVNIMNGLDTTNRIVGDPFADGKLCGTVAGLAHALQIIAGCRDRWNKKQGGKG